MLYQYNYYYSNTKLSPQIMGRIVNFNRHKHQNKQQIMVWILKTCETVIHIYHPIWVIECTQLANGKSMVMWIFCTDQNVSEKLMFLLDIKEIITMFMNKCMSYKFGSLFWGSW